MNLFGAPTVEFCEKAGLGFIKRPFYALSNLAYVFVGLLILYKGKGSVLSKSFGYTAIFIGSASFVYDASYTYISQLVDLLGMFLFVHILIYFSAKRYFAVSNKKLLFSQILSVVLGMSAILYFKSFAGEFVFGIYIIFALLLEFFLWKSGKSKNISLWLKGVAFFVLGFIIWLPDAMGILCDPNNYINGRSIFHVFTSVTIYLMYKYYNLQQNEQQR